MNYGVGCKHVSDLAWLWLWHRPAAASLLHPLAWELPYASGMTPKRKKRKKKIEGIELYKVLLFVSHHSNDSNWIIITTFISAEYGSRAK